MENLPGEVDEADNIRSWDKKIAIVANDVKWIYSGRFKNLINHAKGIKQDLIVVNSEIDLEMVSRMYDKVNFFSDYEDIRRSLRTGQYDYVFIDDKDVNHLREVLPSGILYVYPIRGLWGIGGLPMNNVDQRSSKIRYYVERIALNRIILSRYIRNIVSSKLILTQSYTSSGILRYYYGIEPDFISFNPVDKSLFKPRLLPGRKSSSDEILLFLGTGYGDTHLSLLPKIAQTLRTSGLKANVFGNSNRLKFIEGCEFEYFKDIEDKELSDLYSRSILTLAPQLDEPISYVAIESISTGTPVIATFPDESIENGMNGYYSSSKNFIGLLEKTINILRDEKAYERMYRNCLNTSEKFDLRQVGKRLLEYLEVSLDGTS